MEVQKKKRKTLRAQVSRLVGEAEKLLPLPTPSVEELEVLIERLLLVEAQLKEVNAAIEPLLTDEDAEEEFTHTIGYSDKIVTCLARLRGRVKRSSDNYNAGGGNSEERTIRTTTAAKIKLPKLELLKFNGNRRNWQPFWEQFETAIHKNSDLAPSEKFNYLRAALIGDGAAAIAGLQPTSKCYEDAIDILQQRFGNQAALIQDHIESLMNIAPVSSPRNVRALRRLYDNVQAHLRGLKALGVGEESYCAMLYLGLLRALPTDLSLDYNRKMSSRIAEDSSAEGTSSSDTTSETSRKPVHLGMLGDLLNFLRIEVETLERSNIDRPDGTGKPPPRFPTHERGKMAQQFAKSRQPSAAALHGTVKKMECFLCKSKKHDTKDCNEAIDLAEKKRLLQQARRCFRCTMPHHTARMCMCKLSCGRCNGRHASSMCDPDYTPPKRIPAGSNDAGKEDSNAPVSLQTTQKGSGRPAILLQTMTAWVESGRKMRFARLMFDSGRQRTFITKRLSERLPRKRKANGKAVGRLK